MAVAEGRGGENLADDDDGGTADVGGLHLVGDVGGRAADDQLVLAGGAGHDRDRAVGTIVRNELFDHAVNLLDGQMEDEGGSTGGESRKVLAGWHRAGAAADPGQDDGLADFGDGELAAEGGSGCGV